MRPLALVLPRLRIAYVPVPKCANTSGRHVFYELEHGRKFVVTRGPDGRKNFIHAHYRHRFRPLPDGDDWFRFTIVRDPVERLLSAWSNRVVHHDELSAEHLKAAGRKARGLQARPDVETFLLRLAAYRRASGVIRAHTFPIVDATGHDLALYTRVYDVREVGELAERLSEISATRVVFPHRQAGGPKARAAELSDAALLAAIAHCAGDYAVLRQFDPARHLEGRSEQTRQAGLALLDLARRRPALLVSRAGSTLRQLRDSAVRSIKRMRP